MSARAVRVSLAVSVDGLIADDQGGVGWLDSYPAEAFGFAEFLAGIDTIVMGRKTYEQVLGFGAWPYVGKRSVVLSTQPVEDLPAGAEHRAGRPEDLARELKAGRGRDVWVMGGGQTIGGFLRCGAIDSIELFVVPVVLGRGLALFAGVTGLSGLRLVACERADRGVVRLRYELG